MLYSLDLTKHPKESLIPIPFKNMADVSKLEKDLEEIIAKNLLEILFEGAQLMPIFQERQRQEEADIYALDEAGDLYIFELKRTTVGKDAVQQVLRYGQSAGQWSYNQLESMYKKYRAKSSEGNQQEQPDSLIEAHMDAFSLDDGLLSSQFNRNQHFRVIGNLADESLVKAVDYWKRQGILIEFIPYRLYDISEQTYFEFFSLPYDWHRNPKDIKGVIFDTCASWRPEAIWDMMEKKRVAAYGNVKGCVNYLNQKDIVFFSHKGHGIIAAAKVTSQTKSDGGDELYHDVEFITDVPIRERGVERCISFKKVKEVTGKSFYWATTVKNPYLNQEESNLLIEAIDEEYSR